MPAAPYPSLSARLTNPSRRQQGERMLSAPRLKRLQRRRKRQRARRHPSMLGAVAVAVAVARILLAADSFTRLHLDSAETLRPWWRRERAQPSALKAWPPRISA